MTAIPAVVIGPNTISGLEANGDRGPFCAPKYGPRGEISPPLDHQAARVLLWFRTWREAQAFCDDLAAADVSRVPLACPPACE